MLADVTGSAVLIWRFGAERHQPGQSGAQETRAAIIVSAALAVVSAVLTVESVTALVTGSRPGTSGITLIAAAVSLAVLTPLAYAKRRLGRQMASRALQGDGALSGIGAATSLLALISLALYLRAGLVVGRPDRRTGRRGHRRRRSLAHRATPRLTGLITVPTVNAHQPADSTSSVNQDQTPSGRARCVPIGRELVVSLGDSRVHRLAPPPAA